MKLKDQGLREAVHSVNLRRSVNSGFHQIGEEDEEQPNELDINPYQLPDKNQAFVNSGQEPYTYFDSQAIAQKNHDRFYPNETFGADTTF